MYSFFNHVQIVLNIIVFLNFCQELNSLTTRPKRKVLIFPLSCRILKSNFFVQGTKCTVFTFWPLSDQSLFGQFSLLLDELDFILEQSYLPSLFKMRGGPLLKQRGTLLIQIQEQLLKFSPNFVFLNCSQIWLKFGCNCSPVRIKYTVRLT